MAPMPAKYWSCVNAACRHRNEARRRKCELCGWSKRKSRAQARVKPTDDYSVYLKVAQDAHGVTDESCCVCGRPKPLGKRHDREHDHKTGLPRGIVCYRCNKELLRHGDLESARLVVAYLERVEAWREQQRLEDEAMARADE